MNQRGYTSEETVTPTRASTVVIGLGHCWMSDEGIGPRLIAELAQRFKGPDVEWLDLGTAGFDVLHAIEGRAKAAFIDCALMGEKPGSLHCFTPARAATRKVITGGSQHEGDLLRTLSLARELEACPPDVLLFGIEPETVAPGPDLSATLEDRVEMYIEQIARALNLHA